MREQVRILAIDGGGIRGIIPALVLAELERLTGKRTAGLFDLISGTSTGGILALGLTRPGADGKPAFSARDMAALYQQHGKQIFSRSFLYRCLALNNLREEKYPCTGIEKVLQAAFGSSRLSQALTDVLIPSYEIQLRQPFFFRSAAARTRPGYDFPIAQVARATSAAPTYFGPLQLSPIGTNDKYALVDGGLFANNPAACALVEARATRPDARDFLVVSLGTGAFLKPLPYECAKSWGVAQWAKPVLDIVLDGVSSTVDYQMRQLLPATPKNEPRYFRFQAALTPELRGIDNTSASNLAGLQALAANLIKDAQPALHQLCENLTR